MKNRKGRRMKTAAVVMAAALGVLPAGCGDPSSSASSGSSDGALKYDTRGLTAQQYSVANLTATDDYGRTVTVSDPSGSGKKYVGVFYFMWLGSQQMTGIYDVNKLEKLGDDSPLYDPDNTTDSPYHQFHFASEPLYGYYSMKDPWIIARHVELLTMAGVDYLLLDYTNSATYNDATELLLDTLAKFRAQGWDVPKVGFYTNTDSAKTVENVYTAFYASGKYDELWFRFEGDSRPVIVGVSSLNGGASDQTTGELSADSERYKYFNFYESQWPSTGKINSEKGFPWMQWGVPTPNANGFISASVIQHSDQSVFASDQLDNSSRGYTGSTGKEADWKRGANFQWQWDTALQYAAADMVSNVFVTGWNEWTAIKYRTGDENLPSASSGYTGKDVWFVDNYNAEYSRDIEMGKEYGDGFYIQLTANTRAFKYAEAARYRMATKTISDLSDFNAWNNVFVEYADFVGDAMPRDGENAANVPHSYVDDSNRNDIKTVKVTHDTENVYFYVETAEEITAHEEGDTGWMNLFISAGDTAESFAGFNYLVNRTPGSDGRTTVEKCSAAGFHWSEAGKADYYASGNKIVYKIPLTLLGLTADDVRLSFKVTDNVTQKDDIMDYYVTGDSAPIGRFGYAYGK